MPEEITLCPNCNCMTKNNKCGKCGMDKLKEEFINRLEDICFTERNIAETWANKIFTERMFAEVSEDQRKQKIDFLKWFLKIIK